MMKLNWLKYVLPIMLVLSACSKKANDWSEMNLNGDVRSVWEKQYEALVDESGNVEKGRVLKSVKFTFDRMGRLEEADWFDRDDDTLQKTLSEYGDAGLLSRRIMYDEFGRLKMTSEFSYNADGRIAETNYLDAEGDLVQCERVEYNDENLIETTFTTNRNGSLVKRIVRQMNKNGLPNEVKIYNEDRELINFRKDEYDEDRRLVHFVVYAADEQTIVLDARLSYDKGGNVIRQEAEGEDGEAFLPQVSKYEFDSKNNWTTLGSYVGQELKTISERSIEYY